jgi:hypothetical protein
MLKIARIARHDVVSESVRDQGDGGVNNVRGSRATTKLTGLVCEAGVHGDDEA